MYDPGFHLGWGGGLLCAPQPPRPPPPSLDETLSTTPAKTRVPIVLMIIIAKAVKHYTLKCD